MTDKLMKRTLTDKGRRILHPKLLKPDEDQLDAIDFAIDYLEDGYGPLYNVFINENKDCDGEVHSINFVLRLEMKK